MLTVNYDRVSNETSVEERFGGKILGLLGVY